MARPRTSIALRKSRTIIFRISEDEYAHLASVAGEANAQVNALARRLTLSRADTLIIRTHMSSDPALLKRLERIGNNLNQLVKKTHLYGDVSPEITRLSQKIEALLSDALEAEEDWR